jgi:general secretion pathway protein K
MRMPFFSDRWRRTRAPRRSREGFVIVAVLWILIMLAGLAAVYSSYLSNTALAVQVNDAGVQVEALSSAAVELAAHQLTAMQKSDRPTHGRFDVRFGQATMTVRYVSEAARINLNAASKQLLSSFFAALGTSSKDADRFADLVVAWRTPPKPNPSGAQNNAAQTAVPADGPGNGQFDHVDELWLVAGLPPALVERALPFLTIYSGHSDIDILDAAPQVLAALPDMTPERLDRIISRRTITSSTAQSVADLIGSDQAGTTTDAGDTFRINIGIVFDNGRRASSEAVILVNRDEDVPYHILLWHEDADVAWSQSGTIAR